MNELQKVEDEKAKQQQALTSSAKDRKRSISSHS